ncbi:MAG: FAD-dependent oxidoreductase [Bacilli bacterium]|nr:FAD-dependent oxidoreductase [Bacilli bacterium]
MKDIIIIGAGPSGMTAAIYALRANKSVLLIDFKGYGGQIINAKSVVNYPGIKEISGIDYAKTLYEQVTSFGGEFVFEKVKDIIDGDIKKVVTEKCEYECKSVIIATGTVNKGLGLENEDKFIGRGLSYCATCDGNFYKDLDVAVVGSGEVATDDAIYLSNICNKVYLIIKGDEFKYLDKISNIDNIEVVFNSSVTNINGEYKISAIEINNDKTIPVNGVFVAMGQTPENGNFRKFVDLDENGYIKSLDCTTKVDGIFVAGDNRVKELRQLTTAVNDGAIAATKACKYIDTL